MLAAGGVGPVTAVYVKYGVLSDMPAPPQSGTHYGAALPGSKQTTVDGVYPEARR
jgi:hypothetical protein